jgi:hypothetical protein
MIPNERDYQKKERRELKNKGLSEFSTKQRKYRDSRCIISFIVINSKEVHDDNERMCRKNSCFTSGTGDIVDN